MSVLVDARRADPPIRFEETNDGIEVIQIVIVPNLVRKRAMVDAIGSKAVQVVDASATCNWGVSEDAREVVVSRSRQHTPRDSRTVSQCRRREGQPTANAKEEVFPHGDPAHSATHGPDSEKLIGSGGVPASVSGGLTNWIERTCEFARWSPFWIHQTAPNRGGVRPHRRLRRRGPIPVP